MRGERTIQQVVGKLSLLWMYRRGLCRASRAVRMYVHGCEGVDSI